MKKVQAWLLDLGPYRIAVSYADVVEVVVEPESWLLPIGPRWCRELLSWRGQYISLGRLGLTQEASYAVVIAAADNAGQEVEYVALRLVKPPELIEVSEGDDCELPEHVPLLTERILACFKRGDEKVIVPDLAALFKVSISAIDAA